MSEAEFIRVMARVRPSASRIPQEKILTTIDEKNLSFDLRKPRGFAFDAVFDEYATQEEVFEALAVRIVDGCVEGYNGTIFAYGQTGSGKTHTMLGPHHVENFLLDSEQRGLIPRACEALFTKLCTRAAEKGEHFKYEVSCKFVELYNEDFYDLLGNSHQKLSIRSDSKIVQILGVSEHSVQSGVDMMRLLEVGWDARRTAETAMNRESSRSHAIFIVEVTTEELMNTIVNKRTATLNLVDLAGSERQSQAKTIGNRFKEAVNINLSLTVLGRVIRTLSSGNRGDNHVPYRDSKLTHILRDSLGGNSRTAVIVNLHPDKSYYTETLSTLQFASECRKIENTVHANEDLSGDTVMAYKSEISRLRYELQSIEERIRSEYETKLLSVEEQLKQWKEIAIAREKMLLETQLQRDFFAAQLSSVSISEGDAKDETLQQMMSKLYERVDSIKTYEELTRMQLEFDYSNALRLCDELRVRCEKTEAAKKILAEKYKNTLEGIDETLSSPMRRLNVTSTTGRKKTESMKTPAQKRKERRQTMFTPKSVADRKSHAFKPLLFDESNVDAEGADIPGNLEQDADMVEERELLRLEMENNLQSQIINEKDSQIASLCKKQKEQANEWLAEKQSMLETESVLKLQVEQKEDENNGLKEKLAEERQRNEFLCAKISSGNDERCRLHQQIDSLNREKFDLEDKLRVLQNEQEQLASEFKSMIELETQKADLEEQLHAAQQNSAASGDRAQYLEERLRSQTTLLEDKNEELNQMIATLARKDEEQNELTNQIEHYKATIQSKNEEVHKLISRLEAMTWEEKKWMQEKAELQKIIGLLEETNNRMEMERKDEVNEVRSRYASEVSFMHNEVDVEKAAHERTKSELETKNKMLGNLRATLREKENELEELQHQVVMSKELISQKEEKVAQIERKREEEINKLKKRHADELKNVESQVELEQSAHTRTRQQFTEFRQSAQETFEKKMAELKETFSKKERRMTYDMDEREAQLIQLQTEKESLVRKYNEVVTRQNVLEEELKTKTKENEILLATKQQDDRALAELVGHNNQRQKVSYIEKLRLENYNLKRRILELEKEVTNCQNLFDKARKDSKLSRPATRSRTRGSSRENDF